MRIFISAAMGVQLLLLNGCGGDDSHRGDAPTGLVDAGSGTALLDAGVVLDAGIDGGGDAAPSTCAASTLCSPAFPCVESSSAGYSCQGQFAEWPIPGAQPDAQVPASFDVKVPGVAIDNVTGLSWQRELPALYAGCTGKSDQSGDVCSWEEAKRYCDALGLDGKKWRLPSKIELESIIGDLDHFPSYDEQVFPNASPRLTRFWTSSPYPGEDLLFWSVQFGYGATTIA